MQKGVPSLIFSSHSSKMYWILAIFLIVCISVFYKLTHKKKMTPEEIEEEARKWRAIIYAKKFGIFQDDLRNIHLR